MWDYLRTYYNSGLCIIPVPIRQKNPSVKWKKYQEQRPTWEETEKLFAGEDKNVAIICGKVSGGFFVLEFDSEPACIYTFQRFANEKINETRIVRSGGKSIHMYYQSTNFGERIKSQSFHQKGLPAELRGDGEIVITPPSIHPSGKPYTFINKREITKRDPEEITRILNTVSEEWRYVEKILSKWEQGKRDFFCMGFSAFLRKKLKFGEERVTKIIEAICEIKGDEEVDMRLAQVKREFQLEQEDTAIQQHLGDELYKELVALLPHKTIKKGKEKENIEYATSLVYNKELYEEVIKDGKEFFITKDGTVVEHIELNTPKTVFPLPLSQEERFSITMPSGIEDYGSIDDLRKEMLDFALEEYDPGDNKDLFEMIVNIALTSWVIEWQYNMAERFVPIIQVLGASETGKKRFLTIMRYLFYKPIYLLKTTKVPSLFRPLSLIRGTLILDEADLSDTSLSADFIEFINSRADGVPISRYKSDEEKSKWFYSFGYTILAMRKPFIDDGAQSRCIIFPAETTNTPENYDLLPPQSWGEKGERLQRKLLKFRFDYLFKKNAIPTQLIIKDVRSFRVKTSLLMLYAIKDEAPKMIENIETIAKKLDRRLVEERATSPEGLILNIIYDWVVADNNIIPKWKNGWIIIATYKKKIDDEETIEESVLTLSKISHSLGNTFTPSEISRFLRGLGQGTLSRDTIKKRRERGIVFITNPKRLQKEFYKYVVDATNVLDRFEDFQIDLTHFQGSGN
ncbi:MAG: bifunctional DNA primase/polymerase [Bacillota bacterium]